jgi:hypothetical protein
MALLFDELVEEQKNDHGIKTKIKAMPTAAAYTM